MDLSGYGEDWENRLWIEGQTAFALASEFPQTFMTKDKYEDLSYRLSKAYSEFVRREYEDEDFKKVDLDDVIPVAFSEENYDSNNYYDYSVQCSLDLENRLDIYETWNEFIAVKAVYECDYEYMISNLENADSESWIHDERLLERDELSEITDLVVHNRPEAKLYLADYPETVSFNYKGELWKGTRK